MNVMQRIGELIASPKGASEAYQEIINDPAIKEAFNQYQNEVNPSLISNYLSDLDEFLRNKEKCRGCSGVNECHQPVKGHYPTLKPVHQQLKVSYTPCQYELNQKHLENIKSFHMPSDILNATFEKFIMDPERAEFYEKATLFINEYMSTKKGKGLYLYGPFGTGKTYMLSAIANILSQRGIVCGLVYFPELIAEIKSGFNSETNGAYDKIGQLKEIEILMLDDIGSESMTSWMRDEVLGRILNYRMHQGLPTFFSSNLDYQQLQHHYSYTQKGEVEEIKGARVLERIKALTVPVKIAGTNYRQKR